MFFLINCISKFLKSVWTYTFFITERLQILLFFKPLEGFFNKWNPRHFLQYFKAQSFDGDYIFYWNKYKNNSTTKFTLTKLNQTKAMPVLNVTALLNDYFNLLYLTKYVKTFYDYFYTQLNKSFGFGFYYIRGFFFILFIDACLTDDEPLWEPIEWSLVQTWILFIFGFAWIAENLIVSRYGSYTGRDKRVWMSWYKTFWLIEGYYAINYGVTCIFVCVPYYFETNYNLSFIYSWWHWYSRVFFYKFIMLYSIVLLMGFLLQLNLRWLNWKKGLIIILLINIFIAYLIYTHFMMVFFGYFTDPVWYQKSRSVDYVQLSHEPSKWGWGSAKKDHFTYHNVRTVFWFKNDGPFAGSFLLFHLYLFVCIFALSFYWLSLLRRVWATNELPTTLTTYCVSALRQFFYFFLWLYIFIFFSFLSNYMRLPSECFFFTDSNSWFLNFFKVFIDYPQLLFRL